MVDFPVGRSELDLTLRGRLELTRPLAGSTVLDQVLGGGPLLDPIKFGNASTELDLLLTGSGAISKATNFGPGSTELDEQLRGRLAALASLAGSTELDLSLRGRLELPASLGPASTLAETVLSASTLQASTSIAGGPVVLDLLLRATAPVLSTAYVPNDTVTEAAQITAPALDGTTTVSYDTSLGGTDPSNDFPGADYGLNWFFYTNPTTEPQRVTVSASVPGTYVAVLEANADGTYPMQPPPFDSFANVLAESDSGTLVFIAQPGVKYLVLAAGSELTPLGAAGTLSLTPTSYTPTANNTPTTATVLNVDPGQLTGSLRYDLASASLDAAKEVGYSDYTVWFRFNGTGDQLVALHVDQDLDFPPIVVVYETAPDVVDHESGSNFQAAEISSSLNLTREQGGSFVDPIDIEFYTQAGASYLISVSNYSPDMPRGGGTLEWSVQAMTHGWSGWITPPPLLSGADGSDDQNANNTGSARTRSRWHFIGELSFIKDKFVDDYGTRQEAWEGARAQMLAGARTDVSYGSGGGTDVGYLENRATSITRAVVGDVLDKDVEFYARMSWQVSLTPVRFALGRTGWPTDWNWLHPDHASGGSYAPLTPRGYYQFNGGFQYAFGIPAALRPGGAIVFGHTDPRYEFSLQDGSSRLEDTKFYFVGHQLGAIKDVHTAPPKASFPPVAPLLTVFGNYTSVVTTNSDGSTTTTIGYVPSFSLERLHPAHPNFPRLHLETARSLEIGSKGGLFLTDLSPYVNEHQILGVGALPHRVLDPTVADYSANGVDEFAPAVVEEQTLTTHTTYLINVQYPPFRVPVLLGASRQEFDRLRYSGRKGPGKHWRNTGVRFGPQDRTRLETATGTAARNGGEMGREKRGQTFGPDGRMPDNLIWPPVTATATP